MKYLLTIFIIVLAVSVVTVLFNLPQKDTEVKDVLVVVNGHKLPKSLLEQKRSQGNHEGEDDKALLETIIVNELLLQEAQRRDINKESNFRLSVQNYYEQSLIKILIDRQFKDMKFDVSDEEIDRYISNYGKIFSYTRLPDERSAGTDSAQENSIPFAELSDFLKLTLSNLTVGEVTETMSDGSETFAYRLDGTEEEPSPEPYMGSRKAVREKIINYKQERALTAWIKELRNQATITIPNQN